MTFVTTRIVELEKKEREWVSLKSFCELMNREINKSAGNGRWVNE